MHPLMEQAQAQTKSIVADAAAGTSIGGLILSHIVEINEVLQLVLLIVSIAAGIVAIRYHWKKTPK